MQVVEYNTPSWVLDIMKYVYQGSPMRGQQFFVSKTISPMKGQEFSPSTTVSPMKPQVSSPSTTVSPMKPQTFSPSKTLSPMRAQQTPSIYHLGPFGGLSRAIIAGRL